MVFKILTTQVLATLITFKFFQILLKKNLIIFQIYGSIWASEAILGLK